jgi:hypothetical protein
MANQKTGKFLFAKKFAQVNDSQLDRGCWLGQNTVAKKQQSFLLYFMFIFLD